MNALKYCVTSKYYLRIVIIAFVVSIWTISRISGQSQSEWKLVTPPQTIDLVQVEQLAGNILRFTFKNTSTKTILEYCVSAPGGAKEMVCEDGFTTGARVYEPGSTSSLTFDDKGFTANGQSYRSLYVKAIVYTDGSHVGSKRVLGDIEDGMIGIALETKRIADILADEPDESINGLDRVHPKLKKTMPSTSADAADQLKEVTLSGIPQSYINNHVNHYSDNFLYGVKLARESVSHDIDKTRDVAEMSSSSEKNKQSFVTQAITHGRSDLAKKYQSRSQSQISYIISFFGAENEH